MCQIQTTCQIMEAGPVVYEADGCTQPCSHPPNSHLTGVAPVGMGDACPWECDFAYFLSQKVVDADQNETASICLPCGPEACIPGLEEYHATLCTPKGNRSAFCLPCPLPSLYSRRVDGTAGQCQYECLPNISYRSSVDQQCKPCITAFCPPGFRRVCAENACVPCPPLYTSSVVLMPSDNYTCQASCKSGYLSLSNTNDVATIACVPCAQRPALPCPSISDCPPGYSYMPSPLDFCQKNPSVYDCGLGMYPSPSVCVECPRPLPGRIPILPSQADTIHLDSLVCPSVCPPQYAGATVCIQCSTLNTQGFSFYALWNASNGTRWWPPAQDALMPHLPPRPATGTERRAGICWPCPQGWITLDSDLDLCLTVSTFSQVVVPTIVSPNVVLSQDSRLPVSRSVPRTITGRRLLLSPFSQMRFLCPVFSSASDGSCSCNPGFRYTRATGTCAPVPLTGATSKVMRVRAGPDGTSLVLFSEEARHKRSGLRTRRSLLLLPDHHCGPGSQPEPSGCAPCPLGTYSPYHGMGPCLPCPTNSTTSREGSVTAAECVVPRVADSVFL